eukprot:9405148-Ditylum_brightwellii.AAC.1
MLWAFGWDMLEFPQCSCNIPWHGEVHCSLSVIPIEGYTTERFPGPVYGDFIDFFECTNEVLYILKGGVLYTKIIHYQAE